MVKGNVIKYVDGEKAWVTYAKQRILDNQNFVSIIIGETGGGKSYSGLSYCLQIDPTFDVSKQMVFYFKDVMDLINDEVWFQKKEWKIIMWDEIQIEMSNRKWQSKLNQDIVKLLSTFRAQNIILVMTAPNISLLDSHVRKLLHAEFLSQGWVKRRNLCKLRPRLYQYNHEKDKTYRHKLMSNIPKAGYQAIDYWRISKPNGEALKLYESRKREFNNKINRDIAEGINPKDKEKENEGLNQTNKMIELYKIYGDNPLIIQQSFPNLQLRSIKDTLSVIKKHLGSIPTKEPAPAI